MTVLIILGVLTCVALLGWIAINLERYARHKYKFSLFNWWNFGPLVAAVAFVGLAAYLVPEGDELLGVLQRATAFDVTMEASNSVVLVGLALILCLVVLGRLVLSTNLLLGMAGFALLAIASVAVVIVTIMLVLWGIVANDEKNKKKEKQANIGATPARRS